MQFNIFTLFPHFFESFFNYSLIKKAVEKKIIHYKSIDLRDYSIGNYRQVDDYSFGGGGMLIRYDILAKAMKDNNILSRKEKEERHLQKKKSKSKTIYLSPQGNLLEQKKCDELAHLDEINFICGHYEGLDQRFITNYVDEELSIGNYVLMGGETATIVTIESIVRHLPNVMQNPNSIIEESLSHLANPHLLEYDQYTRPATEQVPPVLLSGHHQDIEKWRLKSQLFNTFSKRPDVFKDLKLSPKDRCLLIEAIEEKFSVN